MRQLCFFILLVILIWPVASASNSDRFQRCLPKEIDPKAKVQLESPDSNLKIEPTVEQRLIELGAKCVEEKLVDKTGKEIRFIHLLGCWGNPPENYQEQLDKQQAELVKLKKKFTVIEIPCDQGTMPIQ